jgi:Ca2+-transporting ATPase
MSATPSSPEAGSRDVLLALTGLTRAEAAARLAREGPNELPRRRRRSFLALLWHTLREPMFLLLLAAGAIHLLLGDLHESLLLLFAIFLVIGIELYQERRTEGALEALRDLSSPRAQVLRDGQVERVPGREVVRGDVILVEEGDRVPADAVLVWSSNLTLDESLLTGESLPVSKHETAAPPPPAPVPGGDDSPFLFSATLVVSGHGIATVLRTGLETEIGRIGQRLHSVVTEETLLRREVRRLVRIFGLLGLTLCLLVGGLYAWRTLDLLKGLLAGVTLAISMVPEEFPVVLTVFLALGAWRMARRNVLTRHMQAIETLGAATVLCVDKTGTLTMNQMAVRKLYAGGRELEVAAGSLSPDMLELLDASVLASKTHPIDPMEIAFHRLQQQVSPQAQAGRDGWHMAREYPLSPGLPAMSRAWRPPASDGHVVAAKGAPEAILELCHLSPPERDAWLAQVARMAGDGLRVLAVAAARHTALRLPQHQREFEFELLGLIGLEDPVRPGVTDALRECQAAGIRVVMITGDYPLTARRIAEEIGLPSPSGVVTGAELETMDESARRRCIRDTNIFARVRPEQKLRLVEALKAEGHIAAMTGDGVNDAPALKSAHIGIAMGRRGTDVAREAASLVLLDDDFTSIVAAVRMGRRIYDNLRRAMAYIVALHVPLAGVAFLPLLFGWPMVLFPIHIVFFEVVTDPACSIAFESEPEDPQIMDRPPRRASQPILSARVALVALMQGAAVLIAVLVVLLYAMRHGADEPEVRAFAFTTLILANTALILTNRSWTHILPSRQTHPNPAVWWITGGAMALLALIHATPFLRDLFSFSPLHWPELAICVVAANLSVVWFEALKLLGVPARIAGGR